MIIGKSDVHHWSNHDLIIDGYRAMLNFVHTKDAYLGSIQDRGGHERAKNSTIGNGERATLKVSEREPVLPGACREVSNFPFNSGKALAISITQHRHYQSLLGIHGYTYV